MAWFTAKEWKDRLVEFAGRRSLKNVSTSEITVYDVTRNEGQVSQEGDSFSATTMNDLEQRISDAFAEAEEANSQLSSEIDTVANKIGKIDGITSQLSSEIDIVANKIGKIDGITSQLSSEFVSFQQSFRDGCSTIAAAITEMGVATANNASPETMASNIRKLSAKVLALSHSNQSKDTTIYTSDRKISGFTLIASDTGANGVLKINGVTQTRKHTQALNTGGNFGYMTYDSTINPGDVVSVYTSAGGGFDVLLLDRILQS